VFLVHPGNGFNGLILTWCIGGSLQPSLQYLSVSELVAVCKTKCAHFQVENYGMGKQKARSWPMVGGSLQYATSATL
jgi:hypothetical protein